MTKNVIPLKIAATPRRPKKGELGAPIMKTIASTVLDPSRRSTDARDFETALHRKIVGGIPVALMKVPRNGGTPVELDRGNAGWIQHLAVDSRQIYFTDISKVYALAK